MVTVTWYLPPGPVTRHHDRVSHIVARSGGSRGGWNPRPDNWHRDSDSDTVVTGSRARAAPAAPTVWKTTTVITVTVTVTGTQADHDARHRDDHESNFKLKCKPEIPTLES